MEQQQVDIETTQLRRAIQAIEKMKVELAQLKYRQHEPIAIVGMGCRYPGGPLGDIETPEEFWARLLDSFDGIIAMPEQRRQDIYGQQRQPNRYAERAGFLLRVDQFDPFFFGLSPREVVVMDPVHRLLLETVWQALEDANIVPKTLLNSEVGVFIGIAGTSGYQQLDATQEQSLYNVSGHSASTASGRISYLLGLTGPCIAVDTACSSSLVAVHQACQSLRNGECHAALAGGGGLLLNDEMTAILGNSNMLAEDGYCKTFDAAADGYVRSEGCGIVVLKRLSDAQADHDNIIAVIQGIAINQDGPSGGLTVPNGPSQQRVVQRALDDAGLTPAQIDYVEAHGTGTSLGDPIEIGALAAVFNERIQPLYVGSVKSNFGHLEFAAGIAGLMKLALAVRHGQIPPHLHFHTPNPNINWDGSSIQVPTETTPWISTGEDERRIGGVSSFGYSGTNAHLIVSEPPIPHEIDRSTDNSSLSVERSHHLLTIAATEHDVLPAYAQKYAHFLLADPEIDLGDLCYTSHVGRSHFDHRLAVTADSTETMQRLLTQYANDAKSSAEHALPVGVSQASRTSPQGHPKIAFLFTGQGSQYVGMGQELYATSPTFRAIIDRCDAGFQAAAGRSLVELLYPDSEPDHNDLMESPACLSAAIFAIECALVDLWRSWDITPDVVLGHSLGDFAAAYTAGVISLEDGLQLVTRRGQLMETAPGSMVSVLAPDTHHSVADILPMIADHEDVSIGVINGPESIVLSGSHESIAKVTELLQAAGFKTRLLNTPVANHSPLLDPVLDDFEQAVQNVTLNPPKLAVISSMTGKPVTDELTDPTYWRHHLRNTVRFGDGVATLHEQGVDLFVEIGPGTTLSGIAQTIYDFGFQIDETTSSDETLGNRKSRVPSGRVNPAMVPSLRKNQSDWQQMLTSLGELYVRGVEIDWVGFDQLYQRRKLTLPTYPFQRQRYWVEAKDVSTNDTESQNQFAQWLATNSLEELTNLVSAKGQLAEGERDTVTKVLKTLVAESQAQQRTREMQSLLYEVAWEPQSIPAMQVPQQDGVKGQWLLLTDAGGMGEIVANQLTAWGEIVELVRTEQELVQYLKQRTSRADASLPLCGVLHLWGLDVEKIDDTTTLMARQKRHLGSTVQIVQAFPALAPAPSCRLWIVTQGAKQVLPKESVAFPQTTLWGLGRIIALEHGNLWGGLIDLDSSTTVAARAETLLAEVCNTQPDEETQVAYRHERRHVARLIPAQSLPKPISPAIEIRDDATYLVTGGLGALGFHTAQWLVAQGARHLILTGRSGVQTAQQQGIVDDLQTKGVAIQIEQVDVADAASMHHLFAAIRENETKPLRGIFHIAGVSSARAISVLQWQEFEAVLRPKVMGGWLLHELSREMDLDIFITYSSGAAIWGGKEQAHYAAANHFLDGLMAYRQSLGLPGLSIAWGPWLGGGMATPEAQDLLAKVGVNSITPEMGLAIQTYLMQSSISQMTAVAINQSQLKTLYELTKSRAFLSKLALHESNDDERTSVGDALQESVNWRRRLQDGPPSQHTTLLQEYLSRQVAQILGYTSADAIPPTQHWAELGMDSLMNLDIKNRIAHDLSITVPMTELIDASIETVAMFLTTEWALHNMGTAAVSQIEATEKLEMRRTETVSAEIVEIEFLELEVADDPSLHNAETKGQQPEIMMEEMTIE